MNPPNEEKKLEEKYLMKFMGVDVYAKIDPNDPHSPPDLSKRIAGKLMENFQAEKALVKLEAMQGSFIHRIQFLFRPNT